MPLLTVWPFPPPPPADRFVRDEDAEESLLFLGAVNLRHEAHDLAFDVLDVAAEPGLRAVSFALLAALGAAQGSAGAPYAAGPLAACPGVVLSGASWRAAEAALFAAGVCRKDLVAYSLARAAAEAPGAAREDVKAAAAWEARAGGALPFTAATLTSHLLALLHSGAASVVRGEADAASRAAATQYVLGRALKTAGDLARGAPGSVGATLAAAVEGLQVRGQGGR